MAQIRLGSQPGFIRLPREKTEVYLDPQERTVYYLFLAHPEGITADSFADHRDEIAEIYFRESTFDNPATRERKLDSMCSDSKQSFYMTVSRIKRKFIRAVGPRKAESYIIRLDRSDGRYKMRAFDEASIRHFKYLTSR